MNTECIIDYCVYDQIRQFAQEKDKKSIIKHFTYNDIKHMYDKLSTFYDLSNTNKRPKWTEIIIEIINC